MNILYLDIGNSRTKIAVYKEPKWERIRTLDCSHYEEIKALIEQNLHDYDVIHIASVLKDVVEGLITEFPVEKIIPFTNDHIPKDRIIYESRATMGVDRFLAAYGAWSQRGNSCIVIDAGTACTIDYIDQRGVFQGGVIMPGLRTMEAELHKSAKALPAVERIIPNEWPPKSTRTAMQWGVYGSYIAAIEAHIYHFVKNDGNAEIWLTGGDAELLKPLLPSGIAVDEFLVFKGLRNLKHKY